VNLKAGQLLVRQQASLNRLVEQYSDTLASRLS